MHNDLKSHASLIVHAAHRETIKIFCKGGPFSTNTFGLPGPILMGDQISLDNALSRVDMPATNQVFVMIFALIRFLHVAAFAD
jgi:hypothetical protein